MSYHVLRKLYLDSHSTTDVKDDDGFVLIERHLNVSNGYFSSDVISTGIENADNPNANTYCIIGGLDESAYQQTGGYYEFKLIYKYSDDTEDVLEWTQTSWLTESTITGADLSKITTDTYTNCKAFKGLGRSDRTDRAYLDGNGGESCWYHGVASLEGWSEGGSVFYDYIPGHNANTAYYSSLWVRPRMECIHVVFVPCNDLGEVLD